MSSRSQELISLSLHTEPWAEPLLWRRYVSFCTHAIGFTSPVLDMTGQASSSRPLLIAQASSIV